MPAHQHGRAAYGATPEPRSITAADEISPTARDQATLPRGGQCPHANARRPTIATSPLPPARQGGFSRPPTAPANSAPDPLRELLRVEDAAARLAIGRTTMFALLRDRVIESVKVGRLRRVPADAITTYINHLAATQRPAAT